MKKLISNVRFAGSELSDGWILIDGEYISGTGHGEMPEADEVIDGKGSFAMPGAIDCHVHYREPGLTAKADIYTESRAAIAGGVTSYLEMPNTKPATTTIDHWAEKMDLAAEKSAANYAFFIGATNDNIDQLRQADYRRIPGVKLFMGSSTGNMLVDDETTITCIFDEIDAIVAVHAEDQNVIDANIAKYKGEDSDLPIEYHTMIRSVEACFNSSAKAVRLAKKYGHRLHLCHLTTAAELALLQSGDLDKKLITSEVSPHHLMWSADDYTRLGTRIKMNPSVKSASDRQALCEALNDGLIDIVATDHAPHQLSEKSGGALEAVSGAPLVQFSLPWMLDNFDETTVVRTMCHNPAEVFRITQRGMLSKGYYADITLVEEVEPYTVSDTDVISKCGWTPLAGTTLRHKVKQTWVNGQCVYADGTHLSVKASMPLTFNQDKRY